VSIEPKNLSYLTALRSWWDHSSPDLHPVLQDLPCLTAFWLIIGE